MQPTPSLLKTPVCQGYCFLSYAGFIAPKFIWLGFLKESAPFLFQSILVALGFITWTFFEYILHRFWMHAKHGHAEGRNDRFNHQHHHTHPTDIRVTNSQRTIGLILTVGLLLTGFLLNDYFSLFSGFFTGFASYTMMHWVLHQPWAGHIFPKLQRQHIHHHLKYPNLCFGVTTTVWDSVFHTSAPKGAVIPEKTYRFYLEGNPKVALQKSHDPSDRHRRWTEHLPSGRQ
jgi:4-hydroxysphinganine ceramide fatty acyl 2-hydroxylase